MTDVEVPDELACAACGDPVEGAGYLPARAPDGDGDGEGDAAGDDAPDPLPAGAVCTDCGFTDVGYAGCAPEPGDLAPLAGVDPDETVLLQLAAEGDGLAVTAVRE